MLLVGVVYPLNEARIVAAIVPIWRIFPMITSKLTSKAQTTIPQPVQIALGVSAGDEIAYVIEADRVVLTKVLPKRPHRGDKLEDRFATFREWDSPENNADFAAL